MKFLDSDDDMSDDSSNSSETTTSDGDEEEVIYNNSTYDDDDDDDDDDDSDDSDDSDEQQQGRASYGSSTSSTAGRRGLILPTKKNARARSLPQKLRNNMEEDDDDAPKRKKSKKKKKGSSHRGVSTARPKLGSGGVKKSSKYDGRDAIPRPTPEDILAGRGGGTNRHDGNIRFRDEARKLRVIYKDTDTDRRTKYMISNELVTRVRQYGGRFLEKGNDGRWYEMDEKSARKKCSQVLREEKWE
jgi:hypothetical protein